MGELCLDPHPYQEHHTLGLKGNESEPPNDTPKLQCPRACNVTSPVPKVGDLVRIHGVTPPRACAMYSNVNQGVTNLTVSQKSSCQFALLPC